MTRRGSIPLAAPRKGERKRRPRRLMIRAFGSYAMSQRLPNAKVTLGWDFSLPQPFFLLYSPKCLEEEVFYEVQGHEGIKEGRSP